MANRKNVSTMTAAKRTQLRTLLDAFISEPVNNPVVEHLNAAMPLMIHEEGFLAWHQHFLAEAENWLVLNGGADFVPMPFWDPAKAIPVELDNGNTSVFLPLPANLKPAALASVHTYLGINTRMLPYHGLVHDNAGGNMPDPDNSPSDPIFWPFHAFLVSIYEKWRGK